MDLFEKTSGQLKNYLPKDGEVNYYGKILPAKMAKDYFKHLLTNIVWENDQAIVFGKHVITKRKVAWYGNYPFQYSYSNVTKTALPWTEHLQSLKARVEQECGETFNACLLNLYHNGSEGMTWHSDSEKELKKMGAIASLSLGAERKFAFKHKRNGQTVSLFLQEGSLLVMKGETQYHWLHRLPPTKLVNSARINLTFRTIVQT